MVVVAACSVAPLQLQANAGAAAAGKMLRAAAKSLTSPASFSTRPGRSTTTSPDALHAPPWTMTEHAPAGAKMGGGRCAK